jgi:hypothetical protein
MLFPVDEEGDRFNEWITDSGRQESRLRSDRDRGHASETASADLLGDGGKLRSTCIATHLGCSLKTVKRELETLRLAGRIEFIGPNITGTYQLVAG